MLPLQLKMSAFCSYLDETIIDFTKFGQKGLYLITGDTGAGKTTIFDAISYALYGEASGDLRDPKLFRSKNAPPETPTFVELTFMSKGKKYTVYRSPEYERPAKRGTGIVKTPAVSTLTVFNGDELSTEPIRKNDNRIEDIIGIDIKKFKQLSMIAQGAFMRVLNAETAEKTEILRAIFGTERFNILQDELKVMAEQYKQDYTTLTNSMLSLLQQISCAKDSAYSEEVSAMLEKNREVLTTLDQNIELIGKVITEDQSLEKDAEAVLEETSQKISELHTAIGKAQEREKTRTRYLETKEKLKAAQLRLPEIQAQYESVRNNEEQAAELEGQLRLMKEKLPEYEKLDALRNSLTAVTQGIASGSVKIESHSRKQSEMQELSAKLKNEREGLKDADVLLEKLKAENTEYNTKITRYRDIMRDLKSYGRSVTEYKNALAQYSADRSDFEYKQQKAIKLNTAFLDEQAGILADTLQPNKPCPVCGSTEHPNIAHKTKNAPTKEQVNIARQDADKASEKASKSSSECSRAKAVCEQYKQSIEASSMELYGEVRQPKEMYESIESSGIALRTKIEENKVKTEQYDAQINRRQKIDEQLSKIETDAEKLRNETEKLKTDHAVLTQKKAGIEENIITLEQSLPLKSNEELNFRIREISQKKAELLQVYKSAEKMLNDCKSMIEAQQTALASFGEISEVSEHDTIVRLTNEAKALSDYSTECGHKLTELKTRIGANKRILDYLIQNTERQQKLQELYLQVSELSNTANGKLTGGKDKVTLEVFAQARYFDSILSLANIRLMKMSNGKYEFCRAEKALEKRGKSGLDIDVIDHDSATRRSVRCLSGGESFMASLSLALGFSDVIQSTVGGVHLETMFIDEGFGTLDEKALENAYRVFADLSSEGSCLVGIISHVEDLKSRITNRIVVTKDSSGNSHARIETDTV